MQYERERAVAIWAVCEAARLCRAVGAEVSTEVLAKKDKSPVTVADYGSQALICRALAEAFPEDPVVAEEDSAELRQAENAAIRDQVVRHVRAVRAEAEGRMSVVGGDLDAGEVCRWIDHGRSTRYRERFWTLDPIDGTKGFLRGEQYAVALALVVHGQVAMAALCCPNLVASGAWRVASAGEERFEATSPGPQLGTAGAVFFAVRGGGAFVAPAEGAAAAKEGTIPAGVPIHVSDRDDPARVRFCESVEAGHSAHGDAANVAARLGITAPPVRMDSQAKYAVVGRGEADIYLRLPTRSDYREKIWDHAAGALIVTEAGGTVTDIHGRPLEFHHGRELAANRGIVVTNGRLHGRVLAALDG
jgi:3'(2'), 5'-bisphosphate nucleotidase